MLILNFLLTHQFKLIVIKNNSYKDKNLGPNNRPVCEQNLGEAVQSSGRKVADDAADRFPAAASEARVATADRNV